MLSGLPKLLGKGFIIGYLLPATLFHLAFMFALKAFGFNSLQMLDESASDIGAVIKLLQSSFSVIVCSVVLLAVNRPLIRFFEGYGTWNPFKLLFEASKKQTFKTEIAPVLAEMLRIDVALAKNEDATPQIDDFDSKVYGATLLYPDEEKWILGTKFGNAMRAVEVYPRVVYGIDGVPMWPHLTMIIPRTVDEKLKDARSILDFTLNTLTLAIAMSIAYLVIGGYAIKAGSAFNVSQIGIGAGVLSVVMICWVFLPEAAMEWGFSVKSVYELNRATLARHLGFRLPHNAEKEFEFWENMSCTMIYRSRYMFQKNDGFRRIATKRIKATKPKKSKATAGENPPPAPSDGS